MSSSPPQSSSSSPSPAPSSASPGHPEISLDGQRTLSQLENTATLGRESSMPLVVPATKPQPGLSASGTLRIDIFPENVIKPIYKTNLPKPNAPASRPFEPALDSDASQDSLLDEEEKGWVRLIDPALQDRYRWLVEQLVIAFADNPLKASDVVAEIVLVAPILDRYTYRSLLSSFISKFEQTTALDVTLLQGLVQMVESASSGYLVGDDLVRIATVLSKELSVTHIGTSDHPWHLTLAIARVLDVMVAGKIKDLNRERDHQPMLQLLYGLKDSDNVVQRYETIYAYQALQEGLLKGIESLQEIGAGVMGPVSTGIEVVETIRVGAGGLVHPSENKFDFMKKCSWYLALQGTALFIRQGRLSDFNQVVTQAPCCHNANFQWGICRQLGEIAVDPFWDARNRQRAVDFLGELFKSCADWKPHVDVKRWILTILVQISGTSDVSVKGCAVALLLDLKKDDTTEFPGSYPLNSRLPLPSTSPLLTMVQKIPKLEYALQELRSMRFAEYEQAVYIDPMAKLSLQDTDNNLFPLMDKVRDFLSSGTHVMLVLGDSGAGKSTFNRHLEHELWQEYKAGGRIPLFVNLPSLERPEEDLVAEQLRTYKFSEDQIHELKLHRQFILICDGYDESQLTSNLHTTNLFNRSGQWDVKLLITCRTQYLGPDYRSRFEPKTFDQFAGVANDLFQQAVIAPFTREQIEVYVEHYVPLEPRMWIKKDYMDKLEAIPNLIDLVRNPFLLTLSLEALPTVVQGKADLSRLRITRAELYDTFVWHWMAVNKRRLQEVKLSESNLIALEGLLADGFERKGILYQMDLAASIFQEQCGRPVVDYSHIRDKNTWKARFFGLDPKRMLLRGSSLLSRAGNQYRFVHRSVLEYFFSRTISGPSKEHDEYGPSVSSRTPSTSSTLSAHPLSQMNLVVEPSIILFLAERVQLHSGFKDELLAIIELSKTNNQAAQAATNAITIL
ncbi:WD_REPEATS_REGION domain-containing protein, partial [Linnemannia elongata]